MARRTVAVLFRATAADTPVMSDRDLLRRFADEGDQAAFAAVVARHTGMVFGVCQRVLHSAADAEDATQAVFLVLTRKANAVRWQPSVANWLYTTARKVARNARLAADRRAKREGAAAVPEAVTPSDSVSGRELVAALDEELDRLPPRYREPLVLCYLEGLTRDEAAGRLAVPVPTLNKQLERGRKKLADALAARGCALGVLLLASAATSSVGATPPRLVQSILAAADGTPSAAAAALAQGFPMNGLLTRTKLALLALAGAAIGLGVAAVPISAEPQKPAAEKMEKPAAKSDAGRNKSPTEGKERTISGKVIGPDGKPVVAELEMVWVEEKVQPVGKTNADGMFKVTVPLTVKGSGGWLVAKAPGHGTEFLSSGMEYAPATMTPSAEVTLQLPKERPVRGRVLDQQGKPVAGVEVVATSIHAYDSDTSADGHLKKWASEHYQRGSPPDGDRGIWFSTRTVGEPYTATSDAEGRFEIAGIGAGQLVALKLRRPGVADKELVTLNRDGFDPAPINKEAKDREFKGFTFGGKWMLYGPDPVVVLEPEKRIRGIVTDHEGKPRAGVPVVFSRPNKRDLTFEYNTAVTGPDGRYEIRGARKYPGYMVEVPPEPAAGLLPCQGFADDTAGYEPITIDLKCARGVVITGTVKNKATGEPLAARMRVDVMANNPFVEKYPPFMHSASGATDKFVTDTNGRYRVVTIPGPVMLMCGTLRYNRDEFKPPVEDPKYPSVFTREHGSLMFYAHGGGIGFVQGSWCKVLNARPTDTELTVDVELEPAPKLFVKVVDAEGKPVTGVQVTGVTYIDFARPTEFTTDTLTVTNVDPGKERFLAVVHAKRKLVGSATVKADDRNAVVKLDEGGAVTGRLVGPDGEPLAGVAVSLSFVRREVTEAFDAVKRTEVPTTDANGEFRIDTLFPGQEFKLFFRRGQKRFGPDYDKAPKHSVVKPGDVLKLGDLKLEPTGGEE